MSTAFSPTNFDVRTVRLPDLPPEWEQVDAEMLDFLKTEPGEMQTLAQHHLEEDIVSKRWFLVKNTFAYRCKRCRQGILPGTIHTYITYACEPRPFHGLNEVLEFWKKTIEDVGYDSYTMRMGEVIVPITEEKAKQMYFRIELRSGKDLAWADYRARYITRYKEYLRVLGWRLDELAKDQWELVYRAAYREYQSTERG